MNRLRFLLPGILLCAAWAQAETLTLREEQLPEIIRQNNGAVRAARDFLESAKSHAGYLRRSYLPDVTAQAGGESFRTGPFNAKEQPFGSVDATVNLYRGGRDHLEEQRRLAEVLSARADYDRVYFDQLKEARDLFWVRVFQREMLGFLQEAAEENEAMLTSARRRIQGGLATDTDRLEFEMNRTHLEQDLARLQLDGRRAERRLKVVLGLPESDTLEMTALVPHDHNDALMQTRLDPDRHRDIRALAGRRQAAEIENRQNRRWWMPSLDLYADYSLYTFREREYDAQRDRDEVVGGAKISMALFDRGSARSRARGLSLQAEGQTKQREQAVRLLQSGFISLQEQLQTLHELIHSAERGTDQGKEYLQRTRSEYARGVKNSPDVLSAFQKYLELKRRYAEIRRDYQLVKTELLATLER